MQLRVLAALLLLAGSARAEEPAFREGDVLGFADVAKLEPFLPPEFWAHRELFFYEGMQLEVGPTQRDYSPAPEYVAATKEYAGRAKLGPDGSLEGYVAGQPFPMEKVDCAGDRHAGTKIAWNFDAQWEGGGSEADFRLSYFDRGELLPLSLEGRMREVSFVHRVEARFRETAAQVRRTAPRKRALSLELLAPFDRRGVWIAAVRYRESDGPLATRADDVWTFLPERRVAQRRSNWRPTDAVAGSDFTFEAFRGFGGVVPMYAWQCLGRRTLIAPMNTKVAGYPDDERAVRSDLGPSGGSFASDRWELRRAVAVRLTPKDPGHPYRHQVLWLDVETLAPLYGFVYARDGALWRIVWHNHRWSGDRRAPGELPWYLGWDELAEPRDLRVVADVVANVTTGSVTRVEFWNAHAIRFKASAPLRGFEPHRYLPGR